MLDQPLPSLPLVIAHIVALAPLNSSTLLGGCGFESGRPTTASTRCASKISTQSPHEGDQLRSFCKRRAVSIECSLLHILYASYYSISRCTTYYPPKASLQPAEKLLSPAGGTRPAAAVWRLQDMTQDMRLASQRPAKHTMAPEVLQLPPAMRSALVTTRSTERLRGLLLHTPSPISWPITLTPCVGYKALSQGILHISSYTSGLHIFTYIYTPYIHHITKSEYTCR